MDGQRNLLHFIAEAVEDKYPEINGFELEISHVEQASRGKWFVLLLGRKCNADCNVALKLVTVSWRAFLIFNMNEKQWNFLL